MRLAVLRSNGKTLYVSNFAGGEVTPITVATGKAGPAIKDAGPAGSLA